MNNLEFRARDKKENKYIDIIGFYIFDNNICLWFLDDKGFPNFRSYPIDRIILEQYIEIKDKNDKKIFAGDIVKVWYEGEEEKQHYEIKYHAYEDYPAFDLVPWIDCDSNAISHYMAVGEIEVIGTIHDK